MPRETISNPPRDGEFSPFDHFVPTVGWTQGVDMQVGITTDSPITISDIVFGLAHESVGKNLREQADKAGASGLDALSDVELGEAVLTALNETYPCKSVWWTPTRYQVNQLIRLLRKARDSAFGRDE